MSAPDRIAAAEPVLDIDGLRVLYPRADGPPLAAVDGLSLRIEAGEIHAIVGESGAGKSTAGNAVLGILEAPGHVAAGRIRIAGAELDPRTGRAPGIVPGRDIGAVFQDPMTSLNPLFTVESQIGEAMRHHLGIGRAEARRRSLDLLRAVGIPEPKRRLHFYPHQLSGGQRQRVVIAAALGCDPKLIIADEPTTALDVSVQAQILRLLRMLADTRGVGIMLVTHNMGVVAEIADRVTIMRHGRMVESGPVREVLGAPRDAYARDLIASVPPVDRKLARFATPDPGAEAARAARAELARRAAPARPSSGAGDMPLLEVEGLTVDFRTRSGFFGFGARRFRAVDGVGFTLGAGEILGLVGESGSGKSTVANAIAGLVRPSGGTIRLRGKPISGPGQAPQTRAERRAVQMVFQDPYASLNPRLRVATTLAEPILFYDLARTKADADHDAAMLLAAVGLAPDSAGRFPHAFSGGQRQRVSIARALAARPALLICDEPTSSLDVSVQAQVLNLLKDLRDGAGLAILFISHDLAVVRQMCDRVVVMKDGRVCETAETEALFEAPTHPYTRELMRLVPRLETIHTRFPATAG
jgi:peptide/nickel transport system ATP-binding protein